MTALFIIVAILAAVFIATTLFLGNEMKKKFRFMRDFVMNSRSLLEFNYKGAETHGWDKGMRNIVIRAKAPFAVLIGFELTVPVLGSGFDYYGFVKAQKIGDEWVAVISTYLGNGPCLFQFFLNTNVIIANAGVSSTDDDQKLAPDATYPPHWFQELGFYA